MATKKPQNKKIKKLLKPKTKLDFLIQERMGQGFILSFTSDLKSFDKTDPAQKMILDGYKSVEPMALAFTVIMNSVVTQRRLFFAFLKEGLLPLNQARRYFTESMQSPEAPSSNESGLCHFQGPIS